MFRSAMLPLSLAVAAACAVTVAAPSAGSSVTQTAPRAHSAMQAAATSAGSYTSRVVGSFGKAGTVRGHFVPQRSFVRNGVVRVQGDLSATLRRADGRLVGRTHRSDVTLPVKASGGHLHSTAANVATAQATCSILHLVLGPLDLNLLGLKVHLDRVVLDITAQSGSGNLLGNLLCAVAHLLDGTSPTLTDLLRLSNLLNRIIGILT
jgi:hypothetical protein